MHPSKSIAGLLEWIEILRPGLSAPSFAKLRLLALAWLLVPVQPMITAALVVAGIAGRRHHAAFYRLFSQATWNPDEVGRLVFDALLRAFVPAGEIVHLIGDDTLARHKGKDIFGIACHLDPVLSTRRYKVKGFGHVWVLLALRLRFPFSKRFFALPFLFRLYRTADDCARTGDPFFTKPDLLAQMLDTVRSWRTGRTLSVAIDEAYAYTSISTALPAPECGMTGRMRRNAALTALPVDIPGKRGPKRKKGERLPSLEAIYADDTNWPWHTATVAMYRGERKVRYKSFVAQWYGALKERALRVVLVACEKGKEDFRVYFQTEPTATGPMVLQEYSGRWAIEPTHRELKQHLGFASSGVRTRGSVERLVPFVGLLYSVVVAWYASVGHGSEVDITPYRPWYRHKSAPSFLDMLHAARRAIRRSGIFPQVEPIDSCVHSPTPSPGPAPVATQASSWPTPEHVPIRHAA